MDIRRIGRVVVLLALFTAEAAAQAPGDRSDAPRSGAAIKGPETTRVHVLLVADTHDQMGATWGRDTANMKAILEAAFRQQKLDGRYTITLLAGKEVTPENILDHYRKLRTGPEEALVFYYSGHGGTHLNKGHFL